MPSSYTCGASRPRAVVSYRCSLRLLARDMQFTPPANRNSRPPSNPSALPRLEAIWIIMIRKTKGGGFTFETLSHRQVPRNITSNPTTAPRHPTLPSTPRPSLPRSPRHRQSPTPCHSVSGSRVRLVRKRAAPASAHVLRIHLYPAPSHTAHCLDESSP